MTDRPHKKNHTPPGTPPNRPKRYKPGRGRPAKWYDEGRGIWYTPQTVVTKIVVGVGASRPTGEAT